MLKINKTLSNALLANIFRLFKINFYLFILTILELMEFVTYMLAGGGHAAADHSGDFSFGI